MTYIFPEPLTPAVFKRKLHRFVAEVAVGGKTVRSFLPVTVNIGDFHLEDLPCLVAVNPAGRKTTHTVKAISVDEGESWIGIDLNFSNRLVEHFAHEGVLKPLMGDFKTFKKEQALEGSRLDFKVDDLWVEVKTPVDTLHKSYGPTVRLAENRAAIVKTSRNPEAVERREVLNPGRMEKQVKAMMEALKRGERAALLTVHQYVPDTRKAYRQSGKKQTIKETLEAAYELGLESWKLDLQLTPEGVAFHNLYPSRISR